MQHLNRKRALELLPLAVDNELSPEEYRNFIDYVRQDEEIRCQYESHKKVKKVMQDKYRRARAPDHLKRKIQMFIDNEDRKRQ